MSFYEALSNTNKTHCRCFGVEEYFSETKSQQTKL